jgi:hypothetical protein
MWRHDRARTKNARKDKRDGCETPKVVATAARPQGGRRHVPVMVLPLRAAPLVIQVSRSRALTVTLAPIQHIPPYGQLSSKPRALCPQPREAFFAPSAYGYPLHRTATNMTLTPL